MHARRIDGGMNMYNDPIIDEIRQIREEYAKQFDYDLEAMAEDLRRRGRKHPERIVSFPPKPPRDRSAVQETPEKYGGS